MTLRFVSHTLAIAALTTLLAPHPAQAQQGWRDTGMVLSEASACFDARNADAVIVPRLGIAYDLVSGATSPLIEGGILRCTAGGMAFVSIAGGAVRYTLDTPGGVTIERYPTHLAQDGSQQVYSLVDERLWASPDAGLTWEERPALPGGLNELAVSPADARVLYGLVETPNPEAGPLALASYTIYFSADAGATWELRSERAPLSAWDYSPNLRFFTTPAAPATTLLLTASTGPHTNVFLVSTDGGRGFAQVGEFGLGFGSQVVYSDNGLLRLSVGNGLPPVERSQDGGQTWQALGGGPAIDWQFSLQVAWSDSASVVVEDNAGAWYSPDGGRSWQALGDGGPLGLSPYLPLRMLRVREGRLELRDAPEAGKSATTAREPLNLPESRYFAETGHTVAGPFLRLWEQGGGLGQFGYPRTGAIYERADDGRVYQVQYFERNRFEYHPEQAGTPHAVQLGLLGSLLTCDRRDEPPFVAVADPGRPEVRYFGETGHTLRGAFLRYWEDHGGLAVYGFPISEEFAEVNPADGKTYQVQYFERNRFEYHPEQAGTPHAIQLGLLGNDLLRVKGWEAVVE